MASPELKLDSGALRGFSQGKQINRISKEVSRRISPDAAGAVAYELRHSTPSTSPTPADIDATVQRALALWQKKQDQIAASRALLQEARKREDSLPQSFPNSPSMMAPRESLHSQYDLGADASGPFSRAGEQYASVASGLSQIAQEALNDPVALASLPLGLPASLAVSAAGYSPEAEASKLRLFSGLSTPQKLTTPFYASTHPAYASKRAGQVSKPTDSQFVHMPWVDDSQLIEFGKSYDTNLPSLNKLIPRSSATPGEDIYQALSGLPQAHIDHQIKQLGKAGMERPNTGDYGKGRWFRISDPEAVTQEYAGGGLVRMARRLAADSAPARKGVSDVIKEKGGNWLTGSVEDALSSLQRRGHNGEAPIAGSKTDALNSWIDKQLTRYVKNEMATPEDPIRALAERGVLHYEPTPGLPSSMNPHASSPLAKSWEDVADAMMDPLEVKYFRGATLDRNPWLAKLGPEEKVNRLEGSAYPELGFHHLIDELSNAMRPDSGLPRELLLDPASLPRVSVPQAVERVAKINEWRAAQKAEADALKANNAATVLHKEYPENNPLGLRWVQLKADTSGDLENALTASYAPGRAALQDALKYEGDTMGHCVGGYCDDVLSGRSNIYSLRDAKGQPHVTIETAPPNIYPLSGNKLFDLFGDEGRVAWEGYTASHDGEDLAGYLKKNNPDLLTRMSTGPASIIQIKGKQNRAPNPEYLPFVQDFVKSGQWSDVGDLQNAGLIKHSGERAKNLGEYSTEQELNDYLDKFMPEKKAEGGLVEPDINQEIMQQLLQVAAEKYHQFRPTGV